MATCPLLWWRHPVFRSHHFGFQVCFPGLTMPPAIGVRVRASQEERGCCSGGTSRPSLMSQTHTHNILLKRLKYTMLTQPVQRPRAQRGKKSLNNENNEQRSGNTRYPLKNRSSAEDGGDSCRRTACMHRRSAAEGPWSSPTTRGHHRCAVRACYKEGSCTECRVGTEQRGSHGLTPPWEGTTTPRSEPLVMRGAALLAGAIQRRVFVLNVIIVN